MRALLRAALLLAAAACAGSQPAGGGQHAGIRLPLWRVKHSRTAPVQPGSWLRPVTQPAVDDEQLYNHRDACVPRRAALRLCATQLQTLGLPLRALALAVR